MSLDTHQSVYREHLLEHLLVAELLKYSWLHHNAELEVAKPELDRAGHDVLLEARGIVRHVQLKTSATTANTARQKVHVGLASKPSGCVIWTIFDPGTLQLGPYLYFGSGAGQPLPRIDDLPVAKHTKGNALGVKAERPNLRIVSKGKFAKLDDIAELYTQLFLA